VGREPDDVDAKLLKIIEVLGDAFEVADAVVVAVGVAPGIDLIEDSVLPPLMAFGVGRFGLGVGLRDSGY
jgi:hypothetical protein